MEPINDYAGDNTSRKNKWKKRDVLPIEPHIEAAKQDKAPVIVNEKAKKLEADWAEYKNNKKKEHDKKVNSRLLSLALAVATFVVLYHLGLMQSVGALFGYAMAIIFILGFLNLIFVEIPEKTKEISSKVSNKVKECHSSVKQQIATEKELEHACHIIALNEITDNNMDPYCSSLAIKKSNGDADKAISIYIEVRVNDLKDKLTKYH